MFPDFVLPPPVLLPVIASFPPPPNQPPSPPLLNAPPETHPFLDTTPLCGAILSPSTPLQGTSDPSDERPSRLSHELAASSHVIRLLQLSYFSLNYLVAGLRLFICSERTRFYFIFLFSYVRNKGGCSFTIRLFFTDPVPPFPHYFSCAVSFLYFFYLFMNRHFVNPRSSNNYM